MNVKVFAKSANDARFADMLRKFAAGVNASGDTCTVVDTLEYEDCDCAVIFGSWKDRQDAHHVVKNSVVNNAKNYIVLETPVLGRGPVTNVMQDDWYRIGVGGFLADTGNFNNKDMPSDRWENISKELGIEVKPYHDGDFILVTLQFPQDASLRGASIEKWAFQQCHNIREVCDQPIIVRTPQVPKQFDRTMIEMIAAIPDVQFQAGTKGNLLPTLEKASAVMTYSSGMGIDSLINGCATVASDPASFVYEICSNSFFGAVDRTSTPEREQWLADLAYAQWHVSEIEDGAPWRHLREVL